MISELQEPTCSEMSDKIYKSPYEWQIEIYMCKTGHKIIHLNSLFAFAKMIHKCKYKFLWACLSLKISIAEALIYFFWGRTKSIQLIFTCKDYCMYIALLL